MAVKVIAVNRKAYHDYQIQETVEAGLALLGTEIKSIRDGKVNLRHAFAKAEAGELWLINAYVAPYQAASINSHDPTRPRKLLLHRGELAHFIDKSAQKGLTIVPLRLYIKKHLAKVELGLARGRKSYDKRQVLAQRDAQREMRRATKVALTR